MSLIRNGVQLATTGVSDYEQLRNLPKINNTELKGNVTIDASNIVEVSSLPTSNISSDKLYKFNNGLWWHNGIQWIMVSSSASVVDGTGITINTATGAINHSNAVTASTAGQIESATNAVKVPFITYDAQGHITAKQEFVTYPPTSVGSSGQYWKSDGSGQGTWQTPGAISENNANLVTGGTVYEYLQNNGGGGGGEWTQAKIVDLIYPINSIYIATEDIDPGTKFGGNWTKLEEGRVLLSAGTTYSAGNKGGNSSVKITASQLPAHTHTVTAKGSVSGGSYTFTGNKIEGWAKIWGGGIDTWTAPFCAGSGTNNCGGNGTNKSNLGISFTPSGSISVKTNPTFTGSSATTSSAYTDTASQSEVSIMQPYLVVYMWKRIG